MNPVAAFAAAAMLFGSPDPATRFVPRTVRAGETAVLVFTRTTGFRHESIPDAIAAVRRLGTENGFPVDATEDPSAFTDVHLAPYRAVLFLLTTGDETTCSGRSMGADHPIAWCQEFAGGRAFYTAGGHTRESWAEPLFLAHVAGGIRWAAGIESGFCGEIQRSVPRRVAPRSAPRLVTHWN